MAQTPTPRVPGPCVHCGRPGDVPWKAIDGLDELWPLCSVCAELVKFPTVAQIIRGRLPGFEAIVPGEEHFTVPAAWRDPKLEEACRADVQISDEDEWEGLQKEAPRS